MFEIRTEHAASKILQQWIIKWKIKVSNELLLLLYYVIILNVSLRVTKCRVAGI